mmetsp:Transcript_18282/g.41576  ORF Transcript_18282/g.41576 Transcript_18282/m.41576 type:complete len:123 (+) Transcript_18282:419-787(+)
MGRSRDWREWFGYFITVTTMYQDVSFSAINTPKSFILSNRDNAVAINSANSRRSSLVDQPTSRILTPRRASIGIDWKLVHMNYLQVQLPPGQAGRRSSTKMDALQAAAGGGKKKITFGGLDS